MVTPGYADSAQTGEAFVNVHGKTYLRTRDLVQVMKEGFTYRGHKDRQVRDSQARTTADKIIKQQGRWVDMTMMMMTNVKTWGARAAGLQSQYWSVAILDQAFLLPFR